MLNNYLLVASWGEACAALDSRRQLPTRWVTLFSKTALPTLTSTTPHGLLPSSPFSASLAMIVAWWRWQTRVRYIVHGRLFVTKRWKTPTLATPTHAPHQHPHTHTCKADLKKSNPTHRASHATLSPTQQRRPGACPALINVPDVNHRRREQGGMGGNHVSRGRCLGWGCGWGEARRNRLFLSNAKSRYT